SKLALNFHKSGHDTLKLVYRLTLPANYMPAGTTCGVAFGPFSVRLALNAKGKSDPGAAKVTVKKIKNSSDALVQFSAAKQDLVAMMATIGLLDATIGKAGESHTVSIAAALSNGSNKTVYSGSVEVLYKAAQGKAGKASSSSK